MVSSKDVWLGADPGGRRELAPEDAGAAERPCCERRLPLDPGEGEGDLDCAPLSLGGSKSLVKLVKIQMEYRVMS